jgi:hypothetical protein
MSLTPFLVAVPSEGGAAVAGDRVNAYQRNPAVAAPADRTEEEPDHETKTSAKPVIIAAVRR